MWIVFVASTLSAYWIIVANAWMQHPVGYAIVDGKAVINDFTAVLFQEFAILQVLHVLSGAYVLTAFFVMSISAYHLLKKQHTDFFKRSFSMALVFGFIFSIFTVVEGDLHGSDVAEKQPAKLAAMESLWETTTRAPVYLFALPDEENERNIIEIGAIPGLLSLLSYKDINAEVKGLKDFPRDERPNVLITSFAFKGMVGLGTLFVVLTSWGMIRRKKLTQSPMFLKIMMLSLPLPYLANELGWILTEVGRQPWVAYGLLRITDGGSTLPSGQVFVSLMGFVLVYGMLGALAFFLMARYAKKGPTS
jgi:cytochrome d ubiquinol oxidase subunit I